jgi:hypothetical protein
MREFRLTIAGHEVEIKSDAAEDTLDELISRALGALEATKLEADQMTIGFTGTAPSSLERVPEDPE